MSRRQRLHVPGGTYYVVQQGSSRHPIFSRLDDYTLFERLLAAALKRTGARVHAYCWTADAIHFVLQIEDVSVGRVMQGLTSRYARSVHQQTGVSGHFFQHRYKAALIDPAAWLLKLTHYLHHLPDHLPASAGLKQSSGTCSFTSHDAYLGISATPWLTTRTTLRLLGDSDGAPIYDEFMSHAPAPRDIKVFEQCRTSDSTVIGGPEFMASLPRLSRRYRTRASLEQIVQTVTCRLGVEREHVLSSSRQRELTLARALIAWYASERGVATLSEVARLLRRDPSTLSVAVSRYRACRPELFKLSELHDVVPLGPIGHSPALTVSAAPV